MGRQINIVGQVFNWYIDLLSTDTARVSYGYEQIAVSAAGLASRSQRSMGNEVLKKQKILELKRDNSTEALPKMMTPRRLQL
jgi:hypothetical protein